MFSLARITCTSTYKATPAHLPLESNLAPSFVNIPRRGLGFKASGGRTNMSEKTANEEAATDRRGPRKLKILMLHGYTQSGPLFHAKTRALEKLLTKSFPPPPRAPHKPLPGTLPSYPGGIQLIYPTAPIRLHPADIPGFDLSALQGDATEKEKEESDAWGWWKKDDSGVYVGLDEGLETIRKAIEETGGIDGVIGFSQGASAAALVASLLEPDRESSFQSHSANHPSSFKYPPSWSKMRKELPQAPLKFAVSYSGFYAPDEAYTAFYNPKIKTRFLHVIGSLDSVVEEERSLGLMERCEDATRVEYAGVLAGFLRDVLVREGKEEEGVEDMDVPF
ncbi:serine hydrolase-domain-containing protein [Rhexocercosporidium sp. MPI-PUGE-AT-0058]|nr:serine hydrolase-domain-containing protein [Rhexocercosporidium sp. MPI-PUGE-AT-0058]